MRATPLDKGELTDGTRASRANAMRVCGQRLAAWQASNALTHGECPVADHAEVREYELTGTAEQFPS
jgi:hypothetical protein